MTHFSMLSFKQNFLSLFSFCFVDVSHCSNWVFRDKKESIKQSVCLQYILCFLHLCLLEVGMLSMYNQYSLTANRFSFINTDQNYREATNNQHDEI